MPHSKSFFRAAKDRSRKNPSKVSQPHSSTSATLAAATNVELLGCLRKSWKEWHCYHWQEEISCPSRPYCWTIHLRDQKAHQAITRESHFHFREQHFAGFSIKISLTLAFCLAHCHPHVSNLRGAQKWGRFPLCLFSKSPLTSVGDLFWREYVWPERHGWYGCLLANKLAFNIVKNALT